MPFSEIIGMAKRKVDVTHQKPYYLSTDNSFGGGSELEWRNGEIAVVQAESSKARNGHDFIDVNNAKMGMFSTVESMLDDFPSSVLVLDEDDRAVPFLDCPNIEQPLKNNECLHELEFSGNDEFINSSNSNHVVSEFALSNAAAIVPILEQQSTLPRSGNSDKTHCDIALTNSAYFSRVPELNVHATLQVVTSDENKGSTHNRQSAVPRTSSVSGGSSSSERASNDPVCTGLKRKTETSEGPSDEDEEESASNINYTASKRRRAYQVHNSSGRVRNATWTKRRRYRVNEKMRELKQLIPNCNQVDKASLLDEAIKYLQTLQLQWQMLSMGSGMYMSPMMLQATMQQALGGYMSPMGFGMGMHDANYSIGAAMHNPVPGHPVSTPMFDGAVGYSHQSGQQVPAGCVPFPIFAGMPNSFINHNSAGLEFDFTTTTNK